MDKAKIYIAGPITGKKDYIDCFKKAEEEIKRMGFIPFNPCKNDSFTYRQYINMGLAELACCDAILMLPGWEKSKGAIVEHSYAEAVDMLIFDGYKRLEGFYEVWCRAHAIMHQLKMDLEE